MSVGPSEHVLILADLASLEVGRAISDAAEQVSKGNVRLLVLEDFTERPANELPTAIADMIQWADVTFYTAEGQPAEYPARMTFMRNAVKFARHAHMPNITPELMQTGMCADYLEVSRITKRIGQAVKGCKKARVVNSAGTDLELEFHPSWKWKASDGLFHRKGMWGNLPDGEIFTAPLIGNGRIVIEELGDWFSPKYGLLSRTRVSLQIEDSRVDPSSVCCSNEQLRKELAKYLQTDRNSNRLCEFAIGTNIFLEYLTGNLLQDEKFPTVHCAFGNPYPEETGASWESSTHVDAIVLKSTVFIDGRKIMDEGRHLIG
jgi:leucyl aminopeptidase (aminopeptidase T)